MPLPIYNPLTPFGSDQINNTQQPINNNFQAIFDLIGVNHADFNTADTFGKHEVVDYYNQSTDPSTGSNEIALYSKSVASDPNILELFYRYPSNGAVYQLSPGGSTSSSQSAALAGTGGIFGQAYGSPASTVAAYWNQGTWQYLSNGIIVKSWTSNWNTFSTATGTVPFYVPQGTCLSLPASSTNITVPSYTTIFAIFLSTGVTFQGGLPQNWDGTNQSPAYYYAVASSASLLTVGAPGTRTAASTGQALNGCSFLTIGI